MLMLIIGVKVGPNWRYYHDRNEVVKPEIQVSCATCVVEENTDYSGFDIDIGGTGPWGSTVVNNQDACAQLAADFQLAFEPLDVGFSSNSNFLDRSPAIAKECNQ